MRKRLIEKFTKAKEGSLGYTLVELLVVIGIIAIICAIAIPSIIAISRALKFKQANDYAKSIFLAAQQNLTEMRADGDLPVLQKLAGGEVNSTFPEEFREEYLYTKTGEDAFEMILPAGVVDAAIRDDQIIIEYNPITGNVYAVFYCAEDDVVIADLYKAGTTLPRDNEKARKNLMVGYYEGSGLNSSEIELEQTQAVVEFDNGQEGIVRVKVPMPEEYFGSYDKFVNAMEIKLKVTGEQSTEAALQRKLQKQAMQLAEEEPEKEDLHTITISIKTAGVVDAKRCSLAADGRTVVVEYPIDSLYKHESFANYAASKVRVDEEGNEVADVKYAGHLTALKDEKEFRILPGENITIQADVTFEGTDVLVEASSGILSGVNPMFEYLHPIGKDEAGNAEYVLAVANGRNMQNLNALAPSIGKQVRNVVFTADIFWNETAAYYNKAYASGGTYTSAAAEAPARQLPYFAPIHSESLFGTAHFEYPKNDWVDKVNGFLKEILTSIFSPNSKVPTLTDSWDKNAENHAVITGTGHSYGTNVYYLNINTAKDFKEQKFYKDYYAGTAAADNDRFTGLFSYVNTSISGIHIVNPTITGFYFRGGKNTNTNNPATGALAGATGYNSYIHNCTVYLDVTHKDYVRAKYLNQKHYDPNNVQTWYGVSGEGAVGGLVGYAKSHHTTKGYLTDDADILAFNGCFAAVNVSGNMRGSASGKDYGYSNGVGGLVGNSQLTNFYKCYASGNVMAKDPYVKETAGSWLTGVFNDLTEIFGIELKFAYSGRASIGAGGFVGTSHGTRYTNCFATGNVDASNYNGKKLGVGGFVGVMCIDETFAYGNISDNAPATTIQQHTVFSNCYAVGLAKIGSDPAEGFSGANARLLNNIDNYIEQMVSNAVGDYYRLLAPHYKNTGSVPNYEDFYIFKDTYYLSGFYGDKNQENSDNCAMGVAYSTLVDLVANHQDDFWVNQTVNYYKNIKLYNFLGIFSRSYEQAYFDRAGTVEAKYKEQLKTGYDDDHWDKPTAKTTISYDKDGAYPFSKLQDIPYYGDWPAEPLAIGMGYYETYTDSDVRHFHFDRESTSQLINNSSTIANKDGYAILSASRNAMTITVNGVSKSFANRETDDMFDNSYHVYLLTDEQMAAAEEYVQTTGQFYVPVTVAQGDDTYTMYFNPNVARSHINDSIGYHHYLDGNNDGKCDQCFEARTHLDHQLSNHSYTGTGAACTLCGAEAAHENHQPAKTELYVRTARQFAALSELSDYISEEYTYTQQLNIDAAQYQWPAGAVTQVNSLGFITEAVEDEDPVFNADYRSGLNEEGTILQVTVKGFTPVQSGFFGAIGETGSVENVRFEMSEAVTAGDANTDSVGVVAGVNKGAMTNVDLTAADVTLTAKTNAGLLAGFSSGTVADCEVTAGKVTLTAPNAGGYIGGTSNTVSGEGEEATTEYAVVNNAALTLGDMITVHNGINVGGFVGCGNGLNCDGAVVTIPGMNVSADYAGGLMGYGEGAFIANTTVKLSGLNANIKAPEAGAAAYMAGGIGGGKDIVVNKASVTLAKPEGGGNAKLEGNIAAGFLGIGSNIDATDCVISATGDQTNGIFGTAGAAGVAGVIGPQSVFNNVSFSLNYNPIKATAGNAAGYALEIQPEAYVRNSAVKLKDAIINASADAAGYACIVAGEVDAGSVAVDTYEVTTDGNKTIAGSAEISGVRAAGFAIDITGNAAKSYATTASSNEKYLGNSNTSLKITARGTSVGEDNVEVKIGQAAGFALNIGDEALVNGCYVLGTVSGDGSTYGFAGTNAGTVTSCMANVDIDGGYAFIGENTDVIARSYGWYANQNKDKTVTVPMGGTVRGCYFANLAAAGTGTNAVTLYDGACNVQTISAAQLQSSAVLESLASGGDKWYASGYASYPYSVELLEIHEDGYPYPMQGDHYGDWVTTPQYTYGVAYYEIYEDGPAKVRMVELSNPKITVEGKNNVAIPTDVILVGNNSAGFKPEFNNEGTIKTAGYAVFCHPDGSKLSSLAGKDAISGLSYTNTVGTGADAQTITYSFYPMNESGALEIPKTHSNSEATGNQATKLDTRFADTINLAEGTAYQVRTPEQLANIAEHSKAIFSQTHSIKVDTFNTIADFSGTLTAADGCTIEAVNGNTWMTKVSGTVNVDLRSVGDVTAPVFASVEGGTVTLKDVTAVSVGEAGALFGNVNGTVKVGNITAGAMTGKITNSVSGGSLETGKITAVPVVDENNVATVPVMFGKISGGTVTGSEINISNANIPNGLFTEISSGTVSGFSVSTTGTMSAPLVGGNLGGKLSGISVTAKSANMGANAQGIMVNQVATGATIENCTVTITDTVTSNAAIFGGMTGVNAGTVKGGAVKLGTLTANNAEAVGGLVGENSGTLGDATAKTSVEGTVNPGTLGSNAYVVGGAVGKMTSGSANNVVATVTLGNWGVAKLFNADVNDAVKGIISPNSNGPIGQFVGYAGTGTSFAGCYGNGGSSTYQFLGQVQHTSAETFGNNVYGEFESEMTDPYIASTEKEFKDAKDQYSAKDKSIANFNVTLSDCYYTNGTTSYQQSIANTGYYADGKEDNYKSFETKLFAPEITPAGNSDLNVRSFGQNTSQTLTNWYYKSGDNNYYPVWYKYEYADRWLVKYYGVQLWADTNMDGSLTNSERFVNISGSDFGNTDSNKKIGQTLYQLSGYTLEESAKYMIVGNGEKALSSSGGAETFVSSFNTKGGANANLVTSIWTHNAGVWSSNGKYLNLNGSVIGSQSTITASIARAGASGLAVSLNGGKYMTYSNGSFGGNGDRQIGAISLYTVTETPVWEMTFSNNRFGQIITSTPVPSGASEENLDQQNLESAEEGFESNGTESGVYSVTPNSSVTEPSTEPIAPASLEPETPAGGDTTGGETQSTEVSTNPEVTE